jgi:hypothetical protein
LFDGWKPYVVDHSRNYYGPIGISYVIKEGSESGGSYGHGWDDDGSRSVSNVCNEILVGPHPPRRDEENKYYPAAAYEEWWSKVHRAEQLYNAENSVDRLWELATQLSDGYIVREEVKA